MTKVATVLIPLLLLSCLASLSHARLYRWVDENGNVHYSDNVPPDQIESGHTELSEGGIRKKSVPRVKTAEELQKERELERLRNQQEELLEEQRSADQVLLETFRSEDDIRMARDGKFATIDVMILVTKNNVRRQQERLAGLRTEAGNLERTGKPIPKPLRDNITQIERAIRDAYSKIVDKEEQKKSIRTSYQEDLVRFRELKDLPESEAVIGDEQSRPVLHNIVTCASPGECDRLWEKAADYVREHATTAVHTSGVNVFITAPPAAEEDISLILSRINDKQGSGASLFLDLHCERSLSGKKMCESDKAQSILEGFRAAILDGSPAPP